MSGSFGRGLSAEQDRVLWARWKDGRSLSEIGRALGKGASCVFKVVRARGGFAPAERQRAVASLTLAQREEISRGIVEGRAFSHIGAKLGRAGSTVSREVRRNGGRSYYRAAAAEERAWREGLRPKPCRLAGYRRLRMAVAKKLSLQWSPQQVSGWLKTTYKSDEAMQVSHETIYKSLFIQARGVLKKELLANLRSKRLMRRGKKATASGQSRGRISEAISISERPAEVADRAVPGHWEGDLICGSNNSYVATLVERKSRFVMLVGIKSKDSESVVKALVRQVRKLPQGLMSSLTWDRGLELAQHKQFSMATEIAVYFCDPKSPWQRGSNENTNGLLRQYLPKGTDLSVHSQRQLDAIARKLNTRPRATLGFKTPADILALGVH